jgi:hypothetical protein
LLAQIEGCVDEAAEQIRAGRGPPAVMPRIATIVRKVEAAARAGGQSEGVAGLLQSVVEQCRALIECEPTRLAGEFEAIANGIFDSIQAFHEKTRTGDFAAMRKRMKMPTESLRVRGEKQDPELLMELQRLQTSLTSAAGTQH